jgi:biopolymer transport protein ExbD
MTTRKKRRSFIKKDKEELEIDITSLLDILVILLVFLLKSYNPSDLKLDVTKNLEIPESVSKKLGNSAVTIQITKDKTILIDNKKIGNIRGTSARISFLENKLKELKKINEKEAKELKSRNIATKDIKSLEKRLQAKRQVNIVMDQELAYSVMQRVMHTSALAGFSKFKFIVQGNK